MCKVLLAFFFSMYASTAPAAELIVSAAASLTNAFREVGKLFEASHPQHRIVFNFAASDVLLSQIAKGAPVDVFASADTESMGRAEQQGLIYRGSRLSMLRNRLVLVVPAAASSMTDGLASLQAPSVRRIAIGNPASVPAGRYAREVLQAAGLWSKLEGKLIYAQSVRQALDYVAREEVDAALLYATDAAIMPGKVRVAAEIPTATPVVYPIALIGDSRNRALGEAFIAFLQARPARTVFERYGFIPL